MGKVAVVKCNKNESSIRNAVRDSIQHLGRFGLEIKKNDFVLIKPNFVAPFPEATTNLCLLSVIIKEVRAIGGKTIIVESSGFEFNTKKTFDSLRLEEFSNENKIEIINLDNEEFRKVKVGHTTLKIPQIVLECDKLINVPKLKMHSVTTVSLGLKNLMGVVHRDTRRKFHILGLSKGIIKINQMIPSYLTIVDGLNFMRRKAVFGEEIESNYLIAGRDIVAVDEVCCKLIGINSNKIKHISIAKSQLKHDEKIEVIGGYSVNESFEVEYQNQSKKTIHNVLFWGLYVGDFIYSKCTKNQSILPFFHWYFGIRPKIDKDKCTKCGKCIEICPANAITITEEIKIERIKCQEVRCFKCMDICTEDAITINGGYL